jgi:two-component system, chemotaxis family, protein-glutamate methylesterase/glutaminase
MKKIKVLIVDDSAVIRQTLTFILSKDQEIEIIGSATDPYAAVALIAENVPDVITLDVEMPRMDGITFLKRIMSQHPIPVVVISSLTAKGSQSAILALEYGAVSVLKKPGLSSDLHGVAANIIIDEIKNASRARIRRRFYSSEHSTVLAKINGSSQSMAQTTNKIIAVGASTGGTEAILEFLKEMPLNSYGIIIVQHMPEVFTRSYAERLNSLCDITVKEASNGDSVLMGHALIAPGNKHMKLKRSGARYYVDIFDAPPVNRHRPSVDVLFQSVAQIAGPNSIGIIMTGMGDDGAKGMLEIKNAKGYTIAQDENSSVVFGMPKAAIKLNAVNMVLPLNKIAFYITTKCFR